MTFWSVIHIYIYCFGARESLSA